MEGEAAGRPGDGILLDMPRRMPLPPEIANRPFPVRDAVTREVRPSRLRSGDLERPFWGVRTPVGESATVEGRARGYLSRAASDHFISHVSAAMLWGIPLPLRLSNDPRLHVSVTADRRAPRSEGLVGHRLQVRPRELTTRGGIRLTTQARTWCDLAALLSEEELVSAGDYLLWWRRPEGLRLGRDELDAAVRDFSGQRGRPRLRSSLPLLSDRSDSPPESVIRVRMLRAGLPAPEVNPPLYDGNGRFLAMPDLAFARYRMAIDYEGDHHRTEAAQWEKDIARVPRLQDAGWHHTRVSKKDLRNSTELLIRLERLLRGRGWNAPPPSPPSR